MNELKFRLRTEDTKNCSMTSYLPYIDDVSTIFMAFESFVPEYHHAKLVEIGPQIKEKQRGAYILPK